MKRKRTYTEKQKQNQHIRSKEWYQKHKDRILENCKIDRENVPWNLIVKDAKIRAKQKNLPFNLDRDYVKSIWTNICPIFNIPLVINTGRPKDNSPSLDRIKPELGYIKGNVKIISFKANTIKSHGTAEEHRLIANYIEKYTN